MQLIVEGMTCDHCVRTITNAIQSIDTQARVNVDIPNRSVAIDGNVDFAQAKAAIEEAGYRVAEPTAQTF